MLQKLKRFMSSEDGAITVDWVVLTAALIGMALTAIASAEGGIEDLTAQIVTFLQNVQVGG